MCMVYIGFKNNCFSENIEELLKKYKIKILSEEFYNDFWFFKIYTENQDKRGLLCFNKYTFAYHTPEKEYEFMKDIITDETKEEYIKRWGPYVIQGTSALHEDAEFWTLLVNDFVSEFGEIGMFFTYNENAFEEPTKVKNKELKDITKDVFFKLQDKEMLVIKK